MSYSTTQKYKDNIYSENTEHSLEIKFGNTIIDNSLVRGFSLNDDIFVNKCFSLGSATICEIKLSLDNDIDIPLNISSELKITYKLIYDDNTSESIPLGTFLVTKISNKNDFETQYTLHDKMYLFDVPYDASSYIPCTRYQLLKHICEDIGVPLDNSFIINGSKTVEVYDSNLTARNYLSYISERACGYAKIISDKVKIVSFGNLTPVNISTDSLGEFKHDELKTVSKVVYTNGSQLFEAGNNSGYVVYLDSNSIFTCTQDEIDNIYNAINGLSFQSTDIQIWGDPSIDTGELIKVGDIQTFAQKKWTFGNGFYGSYVSDFSSNSSKDSIQKISNNTKIKKLQSILDEHTGKFKVISQEQDDLDGRLASIELDLDEISTTVSKTEETVNATVEKFRVNLETNNLIISVDNSNAPHSTANYDIKYEVYFMGQKVTLQPTTTDTHTGITVTKTNDYIRFAVNKNTPISVLDNKYTFKFTYTKDDETYELTKSIIVSLVLQGQKGDTGATGQDGIDGTNGTDGVNQYVHIKYSNDGKTFTSNNGETVGTYMGTLIDTYPEASNVFSNYTWKKIATELTAEATGTVLELPEIPNPSYDPIEFKIYGKSEQEITTNSPSPDYPSEIKSLPSVKNYFDEKAYNEIPSSQQTNYNNVTFIENGIKLTCNQSGVYRYTKMLIKNYDKLLGKTLILNAKYKTSGTNEPLIRLFWCDSNYGLLNQIAEYKPQNEVNKTFQLPSTVPTNASHLCMLLYSTVDTEANVGDYIEYTEIMLSDSYSKYVPHGNFIGIYKFGRNLLKVIPNIPENSYSLIITSNTDDSLHITGSVTNNWANITKHATCYLSPGEYVLSRKGLQNKCSVSVRFTFEDNTTQDVTIPKNDNKKTFTLSKKTIHSYVYIAGMTANTTFNDNLSIQLEKGSISSEYEPYYEDSSFINLEDDELCSIGNFKDELIINDSKAIINKRIGKLVLNGTENWYFSQYGNVFKAYILLSNLTEKNQYDNGIGSPTKYNNIISNYFKEQSSKDLTSSNSIDGSFSLFWQGTQVAILLKNDDFNNDTLNEFKTWLSKNQVEILYELELSESIELNDTNIKIPELTKNILNNYDTEMYIKYWTNAKGNQGTDGKDGKESAVQSATAPEDTSLMWLDTTTNQLKRYNGEDWEVVNDFSDEVNSLNSSLSNLSSSLQGQLNELNSQISQVLTELESKYTQTNNSFDWRINTLMTQINQKTGELEQKVLEQSEYMRFESGTGLIIGKTTSKYTLVSKENGIEIRYNGVPISFWNGNTFSVTRLLLGNFAFTPRDNGSLDFGKVVD